jgi:hypothetical protein
VDGAELETHSKIGGQGNDFHLLVALKFSARVHNGVQLYSTRKKAVERICEWTQNPACSLHQKLHVLKKSKKIISGDIFIRFDHNGLLALCSLFGQYYTKKKNRTYDMPDARFSDMIKMD